MNILQNYSPDIFEINNAIESLTNKKRHIIKSRILSGEIDNQFKSVFKSNPIVFLSYVLKTDLKLLRYQEQVKMQRFLEVIFDDKDHKYLQYLFKETSCYYDYQNTILICLTDENHKETFYIIFKGEYEKEYLYIRRYLYLLIKNNINEFKNILDEIINITNEEDLKF